MKKISLVLVFVSALFAHTLFAQGHEKLFINVTSSKVGAPMAVNLGLNALKQGISTTIFLNVQGVQLAVKRYHVSTSMNPKNSIQGMLAMFMKKGGHIIVCPNCLKANGYVPADLISGVKLGTPKTVLSEIMSSKVISY